VSDWNTKIIEEFRANGGAVGGQFAGAPLLLLHTVGARSGQRRVNPVMYQKVDGGYAVFASKAGAPVNPDWYHNLLAQPQVTAEIGTQTVELVARVADGDERERIWAAQKAAYPGFADYERKTTRQIPVIVLEPARLRDGASPRCAPGGCERCPGRARSGKFGWCLPALGSAHGITKASAVAGAHIRSGLGMQPTSTAIEAPIRTIVASGDDPPARDDA
jgi:deazaflavin-dependent oxidoreductase (nitroreductase family)